MKFVSNRQPKVQILLVKSWGGDELVFFFFLLGMGLRVPEVVVLTLVVVGLVYFVLPSPSPEEEFADSLARYLDVHPPSFSRVAISWNGLLFLSFHLLF